MILQQRNLSVSKSISVERASLWARFTSEPYVNFPTHHIVDKVLDKSSDVGFQKTLHRDHTTAEAA